MFPAIKDPITVLKSFKQLQQLNIPIHLKIIGDGELKSEIEEFISKNKIIQTLNKIRNVFLEKFYQINTKLLYKNILNNKTYDIELVLNHSFLKQLIKSPLKSKKILWIHTDIFSFYSESESSKFVEYCKNLDYIWLISSEIKNKFEEYFPKELHYKLHLIYNPLDANEIIIKSKDEVNDYIFNEIPTFISIGTLYDIKAFDRIIDAHFQLLKEGLKNRVLIIGEGKNRAFLEEKISDLKVSDTVDLIGFKSNPYPYLKKSDIFILSSKLEGFPTVLFEAVILKKKIISTSVSGANQLLDNGNIGLIVKNSKEGVLNGMRKMLIDKEYGEILSENLEKYNSPFQIEKSTKLLNDLINNLFIPKEEI